MPEIIAYTRASRLTAFKDPEFAYRAGQWCKAALLGCVKSEAWVARNGLALTKAHGESINTTGGFLVPPEIASAVIVQREVYGALRATAQVVPMRSDAITIPRRGSAVSASFLGEGVAASEQQVSVDNVSLAAKKLAVLVKASSELDEDSVVDLGEFLINELAYAFAKKEDECGFNGDGSQTYGGIRGVTTLLADGAHNAGKVAAASGHNTFATVDATDLGNLIARLPSNALPGARWFVSSFGFGATLGSPSCRMSMACCGRISWAGRCRLRTSCRTSAPPSLDRSCSCSATRRSPSRSAIGERSIFVRRTLGISTATSSRFSALSGSTSSRTISATTLLPVRSSAWSARREVYHAHEKDQR